MTTTGNPTERMTFAFYGINFDSTKMEDFYHGSRDFLNDLGYFPNKIAVLGIGHTSKMGDFKRIHSRLQKNGFEGVEGFEMLAAPPSATIAICEYVAESMCHRNDNAYAILSVPAVKSDMATAHSQRIVRFSGIIEVIGRVDIQPREEVYHASAFDGNQE